MSAKPNPHSGEGRCSSVTLFTVAIAALIGLLAAPTAYAATATYISIGAEDGWVLESTETSNVGGTKGAGGTGAQDLRAGDAVGDKQYKTVVSFDTAAIPDGATIASVQLRLRRGIVVGGNPFSTHGVCRVDIKGGSGFGGAVALANGDFEAAADATQVATLSNAPANGDWSEGMLNATGLSFINKTGKTQLRVYFATGDNDDNGDDYIGWHGGSDPTSANRPQLVVTYNTAPRAILYEGDFETGQLQANTALHDGFGNKTQMVLNPTTKAITGITKQNPAIVTSANHGYANMTGITITGVNGMTQLNGRLFRVKNATANQFQLWEDQPVLPNPGPNPDPNHALGTLSVNTNTADYGTYTSGGTMMKWVEQIVSTGGAGPGSNLDVRVEATENVNGHVVLPRNGSPGYFLRSAIYFNKDYSVFGGNGNINKPRWNGNLPSAVDFDYDTEVWHGISFYIPPTWQDETARKGAQGENQLLDITEDSGPSGGGFFIICVAVPGGNSNLGGIAGETSRWIVKESHSATSTTQLPPTGYRCYDLGEVDPDKGKWTDFIIRSRINPFSVPTNPATIPGGKTGMGTLQANKGILQIWKATGPVNGNGDRTMTLMVNLVNVPVGMVPREGFLINNSVRQYKYGWHHHNTAVTGPVWVGYDEIRFGETVADGTGYSDVHPSRLPMP